MISRLISFSFVFCSDQLISGNFQLFKQRDPAFKKVCFKKMRHLNFEKVSIYKKMSEWICLASNWRTLLVQQCALTKVNHLTSHLNNVETCVINMITQNLYFGFCQTFLSNKCVRDDVHRNWPIANEQLESQLNSRSCKHGSPLLEVDVGLICQWIQAHGRSVMSKN